VTGLNHPTPAPVLRTADGGVVPLRLDRWGGAPAPEEEAMLERAVGPVLDVGCGPGRHAHALAGRGVPALGIDTAPTAVAAARRRGCPVLHRSVFERLPREGRWGTALLIDGNVGIGGRPEELLARVRALLRRAGHVLVEVEPPGTPTVTTAARIERDGAASPWFAWARVGVDGIDELASTSGLTRSWTHVEQGRWFVQLTS